ncbi:MAG: GNAT family N-acetyltransferase [Eubacterium sp.]|nr:GNAT family N-acetyltransferase [Eubacterium sp.]
MIEYKITTKEDIELLMSSRLEMLREVNNLSENYKYDDEFISNSRKYFLEGDQTTVLALDAGKVIGCASICYIEVMPTFSHPTGKRAHLMNVYTSKEYRRKGIAQKMMDMLMEDAWGRGTTEINLDATEAGRPLYEKCGFSASEECMVLCGPDKEK